MEQITTLAVQLLAEIAVILVGTVLSIVGAKAVKVLDRARKKDELGIIDSVTDRVVEYAQAELQGEAGLVKRDFAIEKAIAILESKGIKGISKDELIAGIENGVNKLKSK